MNHKQVRAIYFINNSLNNKFKGSLFTSEMSVTSIFFATHDNFMYTRVKIIITQAPDGLTLTNIIFPFSRVYYDRLCSTLFA